LARFCMVLPTTTREVRWYFSWNEYGKLQAKNVITGDQCVKSHLHLNKFLSFKSMALKTENC
jgi:hypothetical protein